jgi:hypothetical protein
MPRLLDDPNDLRWLEAERRDIFLRGLLKANDWTATREIVEAVRNEFRIGRSTVYRMIARFRASRKASTQHSAFALFIRAQTPGSCPP